MPSNQNLDLNTTIRSKFVSLTLINWNGFFARTFDLDNLVTTLSGGNGAGKSTTMAGFVTALIPDLSLLNFRNTTEAGSTSGSKDKGLFGKLRAGTCYTILETLNSRGERILTGVRLNQIASREKKVDLKTFSIENLSSDIAIIKLFTEEIQSKFKVLNLAELKAKCIALELNFKNYSAITDYHSFMFDLGLIPKKLRSNSDRIKFYKLIEASLYGGISSVITKSLKDYLLPENTGVRQAFFDMESALHENRMTLSAIKATEADRDMFKALITDTNNYVTADFMRHFNERKYHITQALEQRAEYSKIVKDLTAKQQDLAKFNQELKDIQGKEKQLDKEISLRQRQLGLVRQATEKQTKIKQYQEELNDFNKMLIEQEKATTTLTKQKQRLQNDEITKSTKIENLQNELSDFQTALNAEQTKATQYQQAQNALVNTKEICELKELEIANLDAIREQFQTKLNQATEKVYKVKEELNLLEHSHNEFNKTFDLVKKFDPEITKDKAFDKGQELVKEFTEKAQLANNQKNLQQNLNEITVKITKQKQAKQLFTELQKYENIDFADLENCQKILGQKLENCEETKVATALKINECTLAKKQLNHEIINLQDQIDIWHRAKNELDNLQNQFETKFNSSQQVLLFLQATLENEQQFTQKRQNLDRQIQKLEKEKQSLSIVDPDATLVKIATTLGGILLSELYEDVSLEDAGYLSALYGDFKNAIVVPNLEKVKPLLENLKNCPEDLYLIEADLQKFDVKVFTAEKLHNGLLVQVSQTGWRYSKFPEQPILGRLACEKRIAQINSEKLELSSQQAEIAFKEQKFKRLRHNLNNFVAEHLNVVFGEDLEQKLKNLQSKLREVEQNLTQLTEQEKQNQQVIAILKEQINKIAQLLPITELLQLDDLEEIKNKLETELNQVSKAVNFANKYQDLVAKLQPKLAILQNPPAEKSELNQAFNHAEQEYKKLQKQIFALDDLHSRKEHFNFTETQQISYNDLLQKLRNELNQAQQNRTKIRENLSKLEPQVVEATRILTNLQNAIAVKQQLLQEVEKELTNLGNLPNQSREELQSHLNSLKEQATQGRARQTFLDKQVGFLESEVTNLLQIIRKLKRDVKNACNLVVQNKANWSELIDLAKANNVDKYLKNKTFETLSVAQLRSISDKALGALRQLVADNEYLRDHLRFSENSKPVNKVKFFIAVYQHLQDRIRQDILQTSDPIVAIEQMEIEIARLKLELTNREQKLAISSEAVAKILEKTISREQNRILQLNQGLANISFGQMQGVRLISNIKATHLSLLKALNDKDAGHQDLFNSQKFSFSEALAQVHKRVNPQLEFGNKNYQTIGEELLDYRNYIDLEVETYKGTDGWMKAESSALSTGEAIGTGMSILLMVVQSWEEESRRFRSKDITPCRLLFLDEAARLDAHSINTLFELCNRLDMQLVIAAPENISPEKGTTYKLVRKIVNNQAVVHIVGLKGFQ